MMGYFSLGAKGEEDEEWSHSTISRVTGFFKDLDVVRK